ncbi:hypothetical protein PoB_000313400 [Plakobranchus ocellatus]|uniref:Uncharacterized protein n=1 Tax=Plakobranchus ocellatus TaxID=259542 RepID=A0AAV3Y3I1_9GAST|nr:hypothetical protein PoB_000313400 [Plakobranchus ocellatus]
MILHTRSNLEKFPDLTRDAINADLPSHLQFKSLQDKVRSMSSTPICVGTASGELHMYFHPMSSTSLSTCGEHGAKAVHPEPGLRGANQIEWTW